jgi:hypothetical protein
MNGTPALPTCCALIIFDSSPAPHAHWWQSSHELPAGAAGGGQVLSQPPVMLICGSMQAGDHCVFCVAWQPQPPPRTSATRVMVPPSPWYEHIMLVAAALMITPPLS